MTLEPNRLDVHTRRFWMNNTPNPHHVILNSDHPQNILQVHSKRGQKAPQCPQEPLCGHLAMWVKHTHTHTRMNTHTHPALPPAFLTRQIHVILCFLSAASVCSFKLYSLFTWLVLSLFFFSLDSDDYNRVQLTTGNGSAGCDYINASFIDVRQTHTFKHSNVCAVDPEIRTFEKRRRSWYLSDVCIICFPNTGFQRIQKVHRSSR